MAILGVSLEGLWVLLWYSVCSSLMLIVNKLAVSEIPLPSFVTVCQLGACSVFVLGLGHFHPDMVDELEWKKIKPYCIYVVSFSLGIYTNIRALESSNVDTVIVARCCAPLLVCLLEFLFLGREMPNMRSSLALGGLIVSACGYVMSDSAFNMNGVSAYIWVILYFFFVCFSMVYGKLISDRVPMKSTWGQALYTNILSIVPTVMLGFGANEGANWHRATWSNSSMFYLVCSCAMGIALSYTGWAARNVVSATTFTVAGVLNKMATIAINVLMWDKHASTAGLCWLILCVLAGTFYEQPPKRSHPSFADATGKAFVDLLGGSGHLTVERFFKAVEMQDDNQAVRLFTEGAHCGHTSGETGVMHYLSSLRSNKWNMQALYSRDGAYAVELGDNEAGVGQAVHVFHVGSDAKISRVTMYQASVV